MIFITYYLQNMLYIATNNAVIVKYLLAGGTVTKLYDIFLPLFT